MTIAPGSTITHTDLNGFDGYQTSLESVLSALPNAHKMTWNFDNPLSTTSSALRSVTFIPQDDLEVLEFGCTSYDWDRDATVTATLTGALLGTVSLGATHDGDLKDLPRLYSTSGAPTEVLLKGATYTITVSTTATSGPTRIRPFLVVRDRIRRANL